MKHRKSDTYDQWSYTETSFQATKNVENGVSRQTPHTNIVGEEFKGDYFLEKGHLRKAHGLNWFLASLFVVADMAGGGIVALPTAIVRCGKLGCQYSGKGCCIGFAVS